MRLRGAQSTRGFILLEAVLAVLIFSVGVLALGKCVENCLNADRLKEEDARAMQVLENAMAAVEADATPLSESASEDLKGRYAGMVLKTTRKPLNEKNEKGQDIFGINIVTLQVAWTSGGEKQLRELTFFHSPKPR